MPVQKVSFGTRARKDTAMTPAMKFLSTTRINTKIYTYVPKYMEFFILSPFNYVIYAYFSSRMFGAFSLDKLNEEHYLSSLFSAGSSST